MLLLSPNPLIFFISLRIWKWSHTHTHTHTHAVFTIRKVLLCTFHLTQSINQLVKPIKIPWLKFQDLEEDFCLLDFFKTLEVNRHWHTHTFTMRNFVLCSFHAKPWDQLVKPIPIPLMQMPKFGVITSSILSHQYYSIKLGSKAWLFWCDNVLNGYP